MIKDNIIENQSIKPSSLELERLKSFFPHFFNKDGDFLFDRFKALLQEDDVTLNKEGYELKFLGKSYARYQSATKTETFIAPNIEHNSLEENKNSQNAYIIGDNLDALKHLLGSYAGKIKCIYIDPPYNTGSDDFTYPDDFSFSIEELVENLGIDEDEAIRTLDLVGKSSHSAWLTFMYPRLVLARQLLTQDGVVFISIDDNEFANLKLLCDEIFGEENFIANFTRITKKGGKSSEATAKNHDYLLTYVRQHENMDLCGVEHDGQGYDNKDEYFEERGFYKLNQTLDYDSLSYGSSLDYPIEIDNEVFYPGGDKDKYDLRHKGIHGRADWAWRWSKEKYEFGLKNGFIQVKRSGERPRIYTKTYQKATIEKNGEKYYIEYNERTKALSTLEFTKNIYSNDNATKSIDGLLGKNIFDYTKPTQLIEQILRVSNSKDSIVLDFFSGSATTAHAVMNLNAEDHGNRKYILVQLPEKIKENKPAYKLGYKTIDEIGRGRIKAAAQMIKAKTESDFDFGFKLFELGSVQTTLLEKMEKFNPDVLIPDNMVDIFKTSFASGKEAILTTYLIKDGYGLSPDIKSYKMKYYIADIVEDSLYIIEPGLTSEDVLTLISQLESRDLELNRVVIYSYSINFSVLQELKKNLFSLHNNKYVELIERY
mgnify:FL=1